MASEDVEEDRRSLKDGTVSRLFAKHTLIEPFLLISLTLSRTHPTTIFVSPTIRSLEKCYPWDWSSNLTWLSCCSAYPLYAQTIPLSEFRDTLNNKGIEFMTEDLQLTCSDCGQEFTFSNDDQAFFRERGYSTPKRCKTCRQAKKNEQAGGGQYSRRSESQSTAVRCSGCGKQTTVPFEPRGDRPVYCQECFSARKNSGGGRGDRRPNRY